MAASRDTSRIEFRYPITWLDGSDIERTQRCRLPECAKALVQKPGPGRRRQFCSVSCRLKFKRRRVILQAAMNEVSEMMNEREDCSWAERRALEARDSWLGDLAAEYATFEEWQP